MDRFQLKKDKAYLRDIAKVIYSKKLFEIAEEFDMNIFCSVKEAYDRIDKARKNMGSFQRLFDSTTYLYDSYLIGKTYAIVLQIRENKLLTPIKNAS